MLCERCNKEIQIESKQLSFIYGLILTQYQEKISKSILTENAKDKIKNRLRLFKVEQLLEAINKFSKDEWWMKNNSKRGIAWFFHSDDRIEQFINLQEEKGREYTDLTK